MLSYSFSPFGYFPKISSLSACIITHTRACMVHPVGVKMDFYTKKDDGYMPSSKTLFCLILQQQGVQFLTARNPDFRIQRTGVRLYRILGKAHFLCDILALFVL